MVRSSAHSAISSGGNVVLFAGMSLAPLRAQQMENLGELLPNGFKQLEWLLVNYTYHSVARITADKARHTTTKPILDDFEIATFALWTSWHLHLLSRRACHTAARPRVNRL